MADAIVAAASRRHELADMGRRFRDSMRRRYGFRASTAALRDWARSPAPAPDRGRIETCLARLLAPAPAPVAEAADGGQDPADVEPAAAPGTGIEAPPGETRREWLVRVVRQSYRDGGIPMVVRRTVGRVIGSGGVGGS
jgi:hypothetical protein